MAQKFLVSIDLNKNELLNARLQNLASAPGTPFVGQVYFDTTNSTGLIWNGTAWIATDPAKVPNGHIPIIKLAVDPTNRSNHSGTQPASSISDFGTAVTAYRLDQFANPTAAVNANGQRITNVATPAAGSTDAANAIYVDNAVQSAAAGIDSKPSVRVVAAGNITLSGTQTIDGVSLISGDRVLATAQSSNTANGVYVVSTGAWSRALDADQNGEITPGAFWFVEEGTTYGKSQWRCNNSGVIAIGTTAISIIQFGAASSYTASNGIALVGSDIRGVAKPSGGLSVAADGFAVDRNLVPFKFSTNIGDGSATSYTVTHNLGTQDIHVTFIDNTTKAIVYTDVVASTVNSVTVTFASPPAVNAYRVIIIG